MSEIDDRITFGRSVIYTDVEEINRENVTQVLDKALQTHTKNRSDIQYLYDVYRGKMDILMREKTYNAEITNKTVVNYPFRIVQFKTGYELGKPIQYTYRDGRDHTDSSVEELILFNDYMMQCGKHTEDISLWEWICIAGVGYRFAAVDDEALLPEDSPMYISIPDPRYTFVVYDRSLKRKQKLSCTFSEDSDNKTTYYVYTDNAFFKIRDGKVIEESAYYGPVQPIVEYKFNNALLGAFEVVLSLVNATCRIASNRVDGVEQFIQALMMFKGINIESTDYKALREEGAIVVPPDGDIKYVISELNQEQTQTLLDSIYDEMMEIVGLPRRRTGQSAGDNGIAVVYRDGWEEAESHAQGDETMFKKSEQKFLRLACAICNETRGTNLRAEDIQTNFTRRNYENLTNKADAFAALIGTEWVHPRLLFEQLGMFPDPELAYKLSEKYHNEVIDTEAEELNYRGDLIEDRRTEPVESV